MITSRMSPWYSKAGGLVGNGWVAEARSPGTKAASATGTGYEGTKRDEKANADVAVWRLPKLVAHEHQDFTITLAGTPAGDAVPRGTVAYAKPTAKADAVVNFALQRPGGRGRGGAQ